MNHAQYKEMLQLSVLRELGDEEQQVLARHLQACEACRQELEELEDACGLPLVLPEGLVVHEKVDAVSVAVCRIDP